MNKILATLALAAGTLFVGCQNKVDLSDVNGRMDALSERVDALEKTIADTSMRCACKEMMGEMGGMGHGGNGGKVPRQK